MTAIFISHWKAREPLWLNDRARKKFAIQVNGVFTSSLEGLWNGGLSCKGTWDPSWLEGMVGGRMGGSSSGILLTSLVILVIVEQNTQSNSVSLRVSLSCRDLCSGTVRSLASPSKEFSTRQHRNRLGVYRKEFLFEPGSHVS